MDNNSTEKFYKDVVSKSLLNNPPDYQSYLNDENGGLDYWFFLHYVDIVRTNGKAPRVSLAIFLLAKLFPSMTLRSFAKDVDLKMSYSILKDIIKRLPNQESRIVHKLWLEAKSYSTVSKAENLSLEELKDIEVRGLNLVKEVVERYMNRGLMSESNTYKLIGAFSKTSTLKHLELINLYSLGTIPAKLRWIRLRDITVRSIKDFDGLHPITGTSSDILISDILMTKVYDLGLRYRSGVGYEVTPFIKELLNMLKLDFITDFNKGRDSLLVEFLSPHKSETASTSASLNDGECDAVIMSFFSILSSVDLYKLKVCLGVIEEIECAVLKRECECYGEPKDKRL